MPPTHDNSILWHPSKLVIDNANITHYMKWLERRKSLNFESYRDLWRWSVNEIELFWQSIWEYFDVRASAGPARILSERVMPGAQWFEGAYLNYAENFFIRANRDLPAIIYKDEHRPAQTITWEDLTHQTAALASAFRRKGITKGDRIVAYMPNCPETVIALFAAASIGAIWSSCSPDFGSQSVLDRFQQIEPKLLITVDGYLYNGKPFDRMPVVKELRKGLPTLESTILVSQLGEEPQTRLPDGVYHWHDLVNNREDPESLRFEQVPFDHPLWVLYSSGTTGLPKPIVHGHGGILLEHLKESSLHLDLKPGDRFFWYTSTGWMMWNFLVAGLLMGSTIVLYNGSPGYPDMYSLWALAEELGITYFGTSAAFISACGKAGVAPSSRHNLNAIRALGSTGSPLTAEGFEWVYEHINADLALESISGGTDLCTAFVGGCRVLPVYAGEIQCASLAAKVQAYDNRGQPVVGEMGELVITEPMPSMPLYFWNDVGDRRYIESYFEMYPGIWRHGDWIEFNERGGCIIYGRSDSTIKRHGVRMGTSEIYKVVESIEQVTDSLVIDLEMLGRESFMPLFVVLAEGNELDSSLKSTINRRLKEEVSPRHVPDEIYQIKEVPYTLSGKKLEVPVRRILLGEQANIAANPGAMRNPGSIEFFIQLAEELQTRRI